MWKSEGVMANSLIIVMYEAQGKNLVKFKNKFLNYKIEMSIVIKELTNLFK